MQLQFDKVTVDALGCCLFEDKHQEVTQEVKLSDGMPDIGRVLIAWAQPILRSKEWNTDEITVSGGLTVSALYAPEDGSEVRCVDAWIPFQMKWDLDPKWAEGNMLVLPQLRFADCRSVSARKMMLRCGVSCLMKAVSPMTAQLYSPPEVPEDVQLLKRTYPVRIPVEAGEKTFLQDEEVILPAGAAPVEKLLAAALHPTVTEKRVTGNKIVMAGNSNLKLIYRCPEGRVHGVSFPLPFSQFAELNRTYGEKCGTQLFLGVTNLETDVMEPDKIRVKAGMTGQYLVDENRLLEVTEDAYSPRREVKITWDTLRIPSILEDRKESVRASVSIPGFMGQPISAEFYGDLPKQKRLETGIQITAPGVFQMLYAGEDGMLQSFQSRWEDTVSVAAADNVSLEAIPNDLSPATGGAVQDGREFASQLELELRARTDAQIPMVTALELGELREPDSARPSLILTRAREQDLWSLAKTCGSTVAAILSINDLEDEPAPDKLLLIPVI